jgi:hypothetical protein
MAQHLQTQWATRLGQHEVYHGARDHITAVIAEQGHTTHAMARPVGILGRIDGLRTMVFSM